MGIMASLTFMDNQQSSEADVPAFSKVEERWVQWAKTSLNPLSKNAGC